MRVWYGLLCWMMVLAPANVWGQGLLDGLLGQPAKGLRIESPEKRRLASWKKQLEDVRKLLVSIKSLESSRDKELSDCKGQYQKFVLRYQKALLDVKASGKRRLIKRILAVAQDNVSICSRLQVASASYVENVRALREVLRELLDNTRERLENRVKRVYIARGALDDLESAQARLARKLLRSRNDLKLSRAELRKLGVAQEQNQIAMDAARRALVKLPPSMLRRPVPPPNIKLKPTSRPAPKKKAGQPSSRPVVVVRRRAAPSIPWVPSRRRSPVPIRRPAARAGVSLDVSARGLLDRERKLRFAYARRQAEWIRIRVRDEKLDVRVAELRIKLFLKIAKELIRARRTLASKTRFGLFYYRALRFDWGLFSDAWGHAKQVSKTFPQSTKQTIAARIKAIKALSPSSFWLGVLLFVLGCMVLWACFLGLRGWLTRASLDFTSRMESDAVARPLWRLIRLILQVMLASLMPIFVVLFDLWVCWLIGLPGHWLFTMIWLGLLLLAVRLLWSVADGLFSKEASERLFDQLDDRLARRFRATIKSFCVVIGLYIPVLFAAYELGFPEAWRQWMMVLFYAIIMTGLLLLLFNKDGILSLIPTTHVAGRTTLVLTYRFYPLLLLLVLGLFGVYVWGYINLAAYLTLGISLTLLLVSLAAGLYRLAWVFGLWMFGFSKGQTGLVQVEKKWARNLLRLFRVSVGVLLTLVSVGLLLEIWRVGGGLSAFGRLFVTPFLQIKDTQITLLSLGKLLLSLVVAFWLSKWLRKNCREYLYPALRMSNANQHAANTVLGHAILIIGTLFGFQWMGVGIGVLAVFAGVVGIGVGFGIQNIASNFISGLIITFGQPIKVGDLIEVDGVMGEVKEVSGRSTTIETFDLRIVLIPNSEILTKKVINWSMGRPCVMVKLGVGVAYGSDVKLALETLLAVAKDHPLVLSEPSPALRFGDFGASSLDLSIWVAVADPLRRFEVISDMRLEVDRRFQELDITIAFPQQDVHLHPSLEDAMIHAMKAHSQGALAQASPGTSTVPTRPIKE